MMKIEKSIRDQLLFDFTVAIQPTRRAWVQAANIDLMSQNVSVAIATVVVVLYRMGKRVPQTVIAAEVGVNPGALVRTLDQAVEAGLLKRCEVKEDRRAKEIELLPSGTRLAQQIESGTTDLRKKLMGELSVEDIKTATRVLRQLEAAALDYVKEKK